MREKGPISGWHNAFENDFGKKAFRTESSLHADFQVLRWPHSECDPTKKDVQQFEIVSMHAQKRLCKRMVFPKSMLLPPAFFGKKAMQERWQAGCRCSLAPQLRWSELKAFGDWYFGNLTLYHPVGHILFHWSLV